ncbi:MAG: N-acetyltransferase [Curvibacter sp.]|nr:MAG: N-acetyltransferase [Curvibacter sp.]
MHTVGADKIGFDDRIYRRLGIRRYKPSDFEACVGVFGSNVPRYFGAAELPEFAAFLGQAHAHYWVVDIEGALEACGGVSVRDGVGRLCWGMVHLSRHRTSIGSALLQWRLDALFGASSDVQEVRIETSQWTAGFYGRFGFKTTTITANGLALGFDSVVMVLSRKDWRPASVDSAHSV